jgi:hypothetical protein
MHMDLMPWMIGWAAVTTVVIILALYRLRLAVNDPPGLALADRGASDLQAAIAHKLTVIDSWGKGLTVVSAILVVILFALWSYQTYMKGFEAIGH